MANQFHSEVIDEANKINDSIENLRDLLHRDHNTGADRSFLKAKIEEYEACLPQMKIEELRSLLTTDLDTVKTTVERS